MVRLLTFAFVGFSATHMASTIAMTGKSKTVKVGKIVWQTDYDTALVIAKKANKPMWLHFGENPG